MEAGNEMSEDYSESLRKELWDFKKEVLEDEVVMQYAKEIVIEEIKLAAQIAEDERVAWLDLGIGDILPKIDDILGRVWDWWKRQRERGA